jgi:3-oxoacyl-[acyl-carrier-protein] synthase-3
MNGPEIFNFTLRAVPALVRRLLESSGVSMDEIDHFVFHQANRFMLETLRDKLKLPAEKFCIDLEETGNTVSSTIPIALAKLLATGSLVPGNRVMLVGFGVGYSWGATILEV